MGATYTLDWSDTSVGPTIDYTHANGLVFIDSSIPSGVGATKSLMWGHGTNNDNVYIEMPVTLDAAGTVSFYVKTSTEPGFDWLKFYVDGSQPANSIWSGTVGWTQVSFSLTSGSHTLKWAFTHDGSGFSGSDNVWIALLQVTNMTSVPAVVNSTKTAKVYDFEDGAIPSVITTSTWTNSTDSPITGSRSMRTPATTANNGTYDLVIDVSCITENGVLIYDYKREAEQPDSAIFLLDSTQVYRTPATGVTAESGNQHRVIAGGASTFTIRYAKDGSVNYGADAVWIDNLSLPYIVSPITYLNLSGSGTLTAAVTPAFTASMSSSSAGTLTSTATPAFPVSMPLSGSGTLSFSTIKGVANNLFPGTPTVTAYADPSVNLGTTFYVTSDAFVTQIRYLSGDGADVNYGYRQGAIWRVNRVGESYTYTKVVGEYDLPSPTGPNQWVTFDLPTPYTLTPGTLYRVAILHHDGGYPATSHYFWGGTADYTYGPVVVPTVSNPAVIENMQGTFKYTVYPDDVPDSQYGETSYYSDVTVVNAVNNDFTASASLSGSGSLTFSNIIAGGIQSASLSGSGTLTATATPNVAVTGNLSGSGTLSGPGQTPTMAQPGPLTGTGTLSSGLTVAVSANGSLSGDGTLTFPRSVGFAASAGLSGSGTLTAVARPGYLAAVSLSGSGTLTTAKAGLSFTTSAALSGTGTLSLATAFNILVTKALTGSGALTSVETVAITTTAALAGEGHLTGMKYETEPLHVTGELGPRRWAGGLGPQRWKGSL